jgi:hypothetical protein
MAATIPWQIEGSYFESCNCDAICPCRRIGGAPGGRSTYGECVFALSWLILDGRAGDTDLTGLAVVMTGRYDDDESGSPWTLTLHLDERGDVEQRRLLEDIFLGRLGGESLLARPWLCKPSEVVAVQASRIEVRVSGPVATDETVTCGIPGHDHPGEELYAETLRLADGPVDFESSGNCAFASTFALRSDTA